MPPSMARREDVERRLADQQRIRRRARTWWYGSVGGIGVVGSLTGWVWPYYSPVVTAVPCILSCILWVRLNVVLGQGPRHWWTWRGWAQMLTRLAPEVLSTDRRAPVLYLRPFEADRKGWWYEGRVARSVKRLGPVITVGQPGERLPATPYIAREYMAGDDWQARVVDLLGRAQLVIVQVGTSEGLAWELGQIVRLLRPDQLLVCLGPSRMPWLTGRGEATLRYEQFRGRFGPLFPKDLPAELPGSRFIAFGADWAPIPSHELNRNRSDHPLIGQLRRLHRRLGSILPIWPGLPKYWLW